MPYNRPGIHRPLMESYLHFLTIFAVYGHKGGKWEKLEK